MCILCSQFWIEDHWSDAASNADLTASGLVSLETHATRRGNRLRDRAQRARAFTLILRSRGLSLQDWEGSSYILRSATGNTAVISNLALVWQAVERMTGEPLDPLDPELIEALQSQAAVAREP